MGVPSPGTVTLHWSHRHEPNDFKRHSWRQLGNWQWESDLKSTPLLRIGVTAHRSNVGATTSRIGSFLNTLSSANINYKAAESRISDADIASEAANATRNTILQQTAASLLGQANSSRSLRCGCCRMRRG